VKLRARSVRQCIVLALFAAPLVATFLWLDRQFSPHESSQWADVWLEEGTSASGTLRVSVWDAAGKAVAGARVGTMNNSGGDGGVTDAHGDCDIWPGEGEVAGVSINGRCVLARPHAYWLSYPTVRHGLHVRVVRKQSW
jgi:hypothetical protein